MVAAVVEAAAVIVAVIVAAEAAAAAETEGVAVDEKTATEVEIGNALAAIERYTSR